MQYKDLKEITIKEWDGQPFEAYVCDNDDRDVDIPLVTNRVFGYLAEREYHWCCDNMNYIHAYPVGWNRGKVEEALKPKPKRMTNHQLMEWLAKGHGMVKNSIDSVGTYFSVYGKSLDKPCCDEFKVRKWDSEEWIEPTVDLLEGV